MADEQILWPLRAVSKDPSNATELDDDNAIFTDMNRISDAMAGVFVQKSGDTMTGDLAIQAGLSVTGNINLDGNIFCQGGVSSETVSSGDISGTILRASELVESFDIQTQRLRIEGPASDFDAAVDVNIQPERVFGCGVRSTCFTQVAGGTAIGVWANAGEIDIGLGGKYYSFYANGEVPSYFQGPVGCGWLTPTNALEVGGTTKLRGALEITGRITASASSHDFAPNSIPSSAVFGNVPRTVDNTDPDPNQAGQMAWDTNFLYLHTGANGWKKVPLSAL